MLNVGNFNFDNGNLTNNDIPKITSSANSKQTISPSGFSEPDKAVLLPAVVYSAAGTPLPAASVALKGARAVVSDATTPTYLGAYVSGGAVVAGVICTGTTWVTA